MENKDSSLDNILIKLENIYKIYGSGNTEVVALSGVNLTIESGEYCSIMGTSGSGKSTMMNILGCLDRPTKGEYYLNGDNVASLSSRQLAIIRNQSIGFVFQQFHLLPQLSALDNVILPMKYAGVSPEEQKTRAVEALSKVGLENRLYNRPNQLSGGQQQRVAIARAIVNKPLILLADEPTGALDTETTQEVMEIFAQLNKEGMTIILVTHEHEVAELTHRIIQFSDGKIIHQNHKTSNLIQPRA
ncbi:ABC transporter ATP-binding protein [Cyanobacterium stanieri LEGE 03274]|uniref:ABC transporter ATP-binding protein n=1 Tax=Cyanobacterium stanieri LEGE 03274 TaxID=1828756 RepID=A0ABR9V5B9_9CHRO|nr:ABC transporter ATP-binding protein [Cyanobacterium stanieri]MBE9223085.1 ABC transporter ATP-binding protein [Cyanobacterium stanieri LEGE 03274]